MAFTLRVLDPGSEPVVVPTAASTAGIATEDTTKANVHGGGVISQTFAEPASGAATIDCVGENISAADTGERRSEGQGGYWQ